MTEDLIADISTITTLPNKTLYKVVDKGMECICHSVWENTQNGIGTTVMDIGIGNLSIIYEDDKLFYKFIPNRKFESMLTDTIKEDKDPLVRTVEKSIVTRLTSVYKELI